MGPRTNPWTVIRPCVARASLQRTLRVQTAPTCRIQSGRYSKDWQQAAVATMLRTLSPTEQHGVALGFVVKEQRDAVAVTTTTASSGMTPRVQSLKLHVDTAIAARRIFDDPSKVAIAMSCLGGRARSWAYGRRLTNATRFSTYAEFKEELRQAFEPPKNEFRSRAEFLDLQQGKHDVHAYAQRARYLVSNIVTNPMDETTKVVTFMKDLRDAPSRPISSEST
ncbi:hypothetical protein PC120_g3810 [Phytophthora cactorum]|nr:hypothetical protein PC120_g3810 [Phytophthora cactorum]